LIISSGFELEKMIEFNRVGVVAWWVNGQLLRRRIFGLWQIKTLNVMTPLFRAIDKVLPLPPLSLIAVIRKSAEVSSTLLQPSVSATSLESAAGSRE
jgi:hypothetical protein